VPPVNHDERGQGTEVTREHLHGLLRQAVSAGASDLHLRVPDPPTFRVRGELQPLAAPRLLPSHTLQAAALLLRVARPGLDVQAVHEIDFAYSVPELGRFRINLFRQRGSFAVVVRLIPHEPPLLRDLGLPPVVARLCEVERGMILVTGAAGSGKSTTLASMIAAINRTRRCHIVTIEDPIEYLHRNQVASVSQREVGSDTESFATAFRAVLRQDPDVILVGEMRDTESMDMALRAAETGHLVLSTLHTTDTQRTLNRALSFFAPEVQADARGRLADVLQAVVCQRLLPSRDRGQRVLAVEVMVATPTVRDALRDPKRSVGLRQLIADGRDHYGSQTFDQHVYELWQRGAITYETAMSAASSPTEFQRDVSLHYAASGTRADGTELGGVELDDVDPPPPSALTPTPPPLPATAPGTALSQGAASATFPTFRSLSGAPPGSGAR